MRSVSLVILPWIAALAGCAPAPAPLADPQVVFAEAFTNPVEAVTFETNGGPLGDAWLVFRSPDRIELRSGERYSILAPAAATEFFSTVVPELAAELPAEGTICLAWRDLDGGGDSGAYLLFELGSGRYLFRRWGA